MPAATQSLVGIFKDYSTARAVAEELLSEGFSTNDVHVTSGQSETKAFGAGSSQPVEQHEGGISGWFHRVFGDSDVSEDERGGYQRAIQSGSAAVAVDVDDNRVERVRAIMQEHGPINIEDGAASNMNGTATGTVAGTAAENVIPVVEEQLQVGKRTVQSGGVRVVSRVVSRPVEENLQLREERVSVDRRPVDRAATEADFRTGDNAVEMRETREEAVVGKRARVVEEVVVGKQSSERTEKVRDTVRHTEVDVEQLDPSVRADFQRDYGTRFGAQTSGSFDDYSPAYEYGYRSANNPQYSGKSWDSVENNVREDYLRQNPGGAWDRAKDAVRYGWDKVTQKV